MLKVFLNNNMQKSFNINIENPNQRLIILAIKHINSSNCILGECVIIRLGVFDKGSATLLPTSDPSIFKIF
jgi:hypothetical protein